MTHTTTPIVQAVTMLAASKDEAQMWGPVGGPVLGDGTIALRVSQMSNTSSGTATETQVASDASDNQVTAGTVCLLVQDRGMLWAPTAARWQRVRAVTDAADGQATAGEFAALGVARNQVFNRAASQWDRCSSADATTQAATTSKTGVAVVAKASEWTAVGEPAAATQATATRAAGGAGVVHVCTGLTVCLAAGATAAGPIKVRVLDGAATLWVGALSAPVQGVGVIALDGLALVGTANTAMTLQFDAAGPAASQETVTLHGYST